MYWYSWLLLVLFGICCLILIGSVLLQSGKGDIASALGGGGAQTAFGPRSAASTLARVTLMAATGFMLLSFLFSIPSLLGGGSVATELDKDPLAPKVSPTPLASPGASPAPVTTGETATPAPAATGETTTPAPVASPAASPAASTGEKGKEESKKDNKDAKPENK